MPPPPESPQRLFVTGASGHTGSRVVKRLLADGFLVTCLSRNPAALRARTEDANIPIIEGALGNPANESKIVEAARGCAAIVHIANIAFAGQVLQIAEAAEIQHIICMSSTRRFTKFPDTVAERVIAGEEKIELAGAEGKLDYLVLRPSMIYGDERDRNMEKLARWLRRTRFTPLLQGGRNLIQPIYVDDLVDAISRGLIGLLSGSESPRNRCITLAGPTPLTWKQAVEELGRAIGRAPIWIPMPYQVLMACAWISEKLPGPKFVRRDQVERLLEDKAFDLTEATAALPGWIPRPFSEGIAFKGTAQ